VVKILESNSYIITANDPERTLSWAALHIMSIKVIKDRYNLSARVKNRTNSRKILNTGELENG
jgi:hypothetical protein